MKFRLVVVSTDVDMFWIQSGKHIDVCQYVCYGVTMTDLHAPVCCAALTEAPLGESDAELLAGILKALADPVRVRLVSIIASSGEACACDLPGLVGKSQPTVSHHLRQLVDAGVIEREQRGKWAWFSISSARLQEICAVLC